MSKFYYNPNLHKDMQTGIKSREEVEKEISFMIFRTGSVLIVGKCDEEELNNIYEFLCNILNEEYAYISENTAQPVAKKVDRVKKLRRKMITVS